MNHKTRPRRINRLISFCSFAALLCLTSFAPAQVPDAKKSSVLSAVKSGDSVVVEIEGGADYL